MAVKTKYAGFWRRLIASIIDGAILGVASVLIGLVLGAKSVLMMIDPTSTNLAIILLINLIGFVIGWIYYAFMESSARQATVGKMAIGIKVTDMDGKRISFLKASVRHFAKILSGITLGIGYLMIGFTEKKQGLHDIISDCLVVKGR